MKHFITREFITLGGLHLNNKNLHVKTDLHFTMKYFISTDSFQCDTNFNQERLEII